MVDNASNVGGTENTQTNKATPEERQAMKVDHAKAQFAKLVDKLDTNKNGLDGAELTKGLKRRLEATDTGSILADGKVSEAEYVTMKTGTKAQKFDLLDKNNDNKLDNTEAFQKTINKRDADRDGKLTETEYSNRKDAQRFRGLDHNKDGVISATDGKPAEKMVTKFDSGTKDGKVTFDEFVAGRAAQKGGGTNQA